MVLPPGSPRWASLREAARARGASVRLVPWTALAAGDHAGLRDADLVKLDSPGRCEETRRALVGAGADDPRGFAAGLQRVLAALPADVPWSTPPDAVWAMVDKPTTAARLQAAGIRCPQGFAAELEIDGGLWARGWDPVYVKLRTGSCADAIVFLQGDTGLSTVVPDGDGVRSVSPMAPLRAEALGHVLRWLLSQRTWVERAVPSVRLGFDRVDLRVVVIDGAARFTVARQSAQPVTNLTAGGRRADPDRVRALLGPRAWRDAHDVAVAAAAVFGARSVGVDVVVDPAGEPHVLELNPFGDWFPGLPIHAAQLEAWLR
ncbi:MAG: hypothetical protein R3F59_17170 [Myxococcota bacterium]